MGRNNQIILVGAFHEMVELCEYCGKEIVGIIDQATKGTFMGYQVLGDDHSAPAIYERWGSIPVVLSPDMPAKRRGLRDHYARIGFGFETLIHPKAMVSKSASIGKGVVVQAGTHISSKVVINDFARINVFANLMHDVSVGTFATIAPNAVLLGHVSIGEGSYVGGNATLLPGVGIGEGAMIGAGATVTRNVGNHVTVVGNAAREMDFSPKTRV